MHSSNGVDPTKPFVVKIDANATVVGDALVQDGHPIAFESKKVNPFQCKYLDYEHKLFTIIHALKKWCHYLYGAKFKAIFDCESIKW